MDWDKHPILFFIYFDAWTMIDSLWTFWAGRTEWPVRKSRGRLRRIRRSVTKHCSMCSFEYLFLSFKTKFNLCTLQKLHLKNSNLSWTVFPFYHDNWKNRIIIHFTRKIMNKYCPISWEALQQFISVKCVSSNKVILSRFILICKVKINWSVNYQYLY